MGPIIVTGAGGLVGRAIAERLSAAGRSVIGVVRSGSGSSPFETVELDLERRSVDDLQGRAPAAVVHCAARILTGQQPDDEQANAAATRRMDDGVIEACAAQGWRLLYVSTCILYDRFDPETKTEEASVQATSPYAEAKLRGEREALALPGSLVLRIPSPVGGRMRRTTVLPRFIDLTLGDAPVEVWGRGLREQDFVHVADIAAFAEVALHAGSTGIFNVASGRSVSMLELAASVVAVLGRGSVRFTGRPDPLDGETARYSVARATGLGWAPRVSLDAMIQELAAGLPVRG